MVVYFSIQLVIVLWETSVPINFSDFSVLRRVSPLKYSCIAVVTAMGLCFIFSNPILILNHLPQSWHSYFCRSPLLLCLIPSFLILMSYTAGQLVTVIGSSMIFGFACFLIPRLISTAQMCLHFIPLCL